MPLFTPTLTLAALAATLRGGEPPRLPASTGAAPPAGPAARPAAHWLLAHACGTGPELPPALVRRLLLLQAHALSLAPSVNPLIVKRLLDFYNRDVWPVVYEQGAAETPLAHLALPLLGLGEVHYQGYRLAAADVLSLFSWEPLALAEPESRALLAGAGLALAYATEALERAAQVGRAAVAIAALSAAEPAPGPEALTQTAQLVEAAGNAPGLNADLSLAFNQLAATLAAVGQASAERTGRLLAAPPTGTADFAGLVALPGVAASLATESQQLAAPAAPAPATVRRIVENTEQLLGLELLAAAPVPGEHRAGFDGPLPVVVAAFREVVTFVAHDRAPAPDLHRAARFVREYAWA